VCITLVHTVSMELKEYYIYLYFTINMVAQIINNTLLNELILFNIHC